MQQPDLFVICNSQKEC